VPFSVQTTNALVKQCFDSSKADTFISFCHNLQQDIFSSVQSTFYGNLQLGNVLVAHIAAFPETASLIQTFKFNAATWKAGKLAKVPSPIALI
jgi:hypothetical protein